jgi:cell division protease FtsH
MKGLTELAELLLEKEVIFSEDLERIFGKRKADLLKDEKEAEAKSATLLLNGKDKTKEVKKGKRTAKSSSEKTKTRSAKKETVTENPVVPEKPVKKARSKGKE